MAQALNRFWGVSRHPRLPAEPGRLGGCLPEILPDESCPLRLLCTFVSNLCFSTHHSISLSSLSLPRSIHSFIFASETFSHRDKLSARPTHSSTQASPQSSNPPTLRRHRFALSIVNVPLSCARLLPTPTPATLHHNCCTSSAGIYVDFILLYVAFAPPGG